MTAALVACSHIYKVGHKEKNTCLFSEKDEISCGYASITSTTSLSESYSDNLHNLATILPLTAPNVCVDNYMYDKRGRG